MGWSTALSLALRFSTSSCGHASLRGNANLMIAGAAMRRIGIALADVAFWFAQHYATCGQQTRACKLQR